MAAYERKDTWYRKAKQEGYRSRSAFKLIELNRRLRLLRPGMKVLDLGCAPGGWMQVAAREVGKLGRVVGIDLEAIPPLGLPQAIALVGNILLPETLDRLRETLAGPADLVLSDIAPDTSGVGFADHTRSVELVGAAAKVAAALLSPGGLLVAKVFDGPDLPGLLQNLRDRFEAPKRIRPEATRKGSRELYLVMRRLDMKGTKQHSQAAVPEA